MDLSNHTVDNENDFKLSFETIFPVTSYELYTNNTNMKYMLFSLVFKVFNGI